MKSREIVIQKFDVSIHTKILNIFQGSGKEYWCQYRLFPMWNKVRSHVNLREGN
jgi:hypothetical protein